MLSSRIVLKDISQGHIAFLSRSVHFNISQHHIQLDRVCSVIRYYVSYVTVKNSGLAHLANFSHIFIFGIKHNIFGWNDNSMECLNSSNLRCLWCIVDWGIKCHFDSRDILTLPRLIWPCLLKPYLPFPSPFILTIPLSPSLVTFLYMYLIQTEPIRRRDRGGYD